MLLVPSNFRLSHLNWSSGVFLVSGAGSRGFDPHEGPVSLALLPGSPRPRAGTAQLGTCPPPGLFMGSFHPKAFSSLFMGFFWSGALGGPSCPASAGERMGVGLGEVKGHNCPLPSHPRILEAVSAPTKGHSELLPGHAPDPRGKPRCWLRLLKVDDTCFSCGQSSGSGW